MLISFREIRNKYKINVKGILHIGAHYAEEAESYKTCGVDNVIWIEADTDTFKVLNDKLSNYKNNKSFCFAASNLDGQELNFNVTNNGESSSLLELKEHLIEHPHISVINKKKVFTKKIDSFVKEENIDLINYNFLNLDIQGAELLALKGMTESLNKIDYIYSEVNEKELYENCALIQEVDEFLLKYNFHRVETKMTPHGWGDALYIKNK
jgi:FkbM family methyltransferase